MWGQHLPLQLPISNSNYLALFGRHSICVSHLGNLPIFSFFFVVVLPRRNKPKQFTFLFLNVFWWRWRWASLFTENPFDVKNSDVGSISYGEFASTWCKAQNQLPVPVSSFQRMRKVWFPGGEFRLPGFFFFFWSPVMCWRCSLHGLYFWGKKAYGSLKKGWRNYPKILTSFGHAKTLCLKAGCKKDITERWTKAR